MIIINYDIPTRYKFDFDEKKLSKVVVKKVLEAEKIDLDISISLSIVSKSKIKKINKTERDIDSDTDVLSFPNIQFKKPACFKGLITKDDIDVSIIDLSNNTIFLGDVVICFDKIISQSKLFGHSIKREFAFLLTHSMYHLLGYDHMNKKDENVMFKKQDLVLDSLKIYR